jgi:hypothetical protein
VHNGERSRAPSTAHRQGDGERDEDGGLDLHVDGEGE